MKLSYEELRMAIDFSSEEVRYEADFASIDVGTELTVWAYDIPYSEGGEEPTIDETKATYALRLKIRACMLVDPANFPEWDQEIEPVIAFEATVLRRTLSEAHHFNEEGAQGAFGYLCRNNSVGFIFDSDPDSDLTNRTIWAMLAYHGALPE